MYLGRALTESAKADKAKHILDTTYKLYQQSTFNDIRMIDIAQEAAISKGTLFNYFSTKEKLFTELLNSEHDRRLRNLIELIKPYKEMGHSEFKRMFLIEMDGILDDKTVLMRLTAIKYLVLDKNIDYRTAINAKMKMYAYVEELSDMLAERINYMTKKDGLDLLMAQYAICIGYMNVISIPDIVKETIEENQLEGFKVDFRKNALRTMAYYLDGLYKNRV